LNGAENAITPEISRDLDIRNNLTTINGAGMGTTIIDGGGIDRVFEVQINKNVTFNNLAMIHGAPVGTGPLGQPLPLNGGGITTAGGSTVNMNYVTIAENTADAGGGIWNGGTMTVNFSSIHANVATSNGGGAFNGNTNATLNVGYSVFHSNQAGGAGGGAVYNDNTMTLLNTTISNNAATASGGGGGGILNYTSTNANLWNVTLADNSSSSGDKGGGIRNFGGMAVRNSILSNNSGGGGNCSPVGPYSQQPVGSAGDNISSDASCGFGAAGDMQNTQANIGGLQSNGGPTPTRAIGPGSPAINTDTHAGDCLPNDQRGVGRPSGGGCDIGAFEYDTGPAPTPTPGPTSSPTPTPVPTPTLPPDSFGNVDCMDGISSVDALKVLRAASGMGYTQYEPCANVGSEMTVWNELQGDVDCDNTANSVDALKLLRFNAGMSVSQNEPCPNIGS
jgi:hypothetical protein